MAVERAAGALAESIPAEAINTLAEGAAESSVEGAADALATLIAAGAIDALAGGAVWPC